MTNSETEILIIIFSCLEVISESMIHHGLILYLNIIIYLLIYILLYLISILKLIYSKIYYTGIWFHKL